MNMFEELKAWADKWGAGYYIREDEHTIHIYFYGQSCSDAEFSYNKKTGDYCWFGGD